MPEKIARIAESHDAVIFTLDWHPADHCSFLEQGGPWPSHCVAYTQGAGLADAFAPILAKKDKVRLFLKGTDPSKEQYGAFEGDSGIDGTILEWFAKADEVDICGIAGDYCVKESANNLLGFVPASKVTMLLGLIRSIDDGTTLRAFIKEKGLRSRD